MFKVLIADDEKYIRNGIADHIDWGQLGCKIIGLAADGEEAMILVEERQPHLIITDIMMPIMTGLELVEKVKEKYPDTYIIIISGYDEFNYVQKAIKLGAEDYVLKPVDLDYLSEYVKKLKNEYEKNIEKEEEFIQLKKKVNESTPVIVRGIIRDIMFERVPAEDGLTLIQEYCSTEENDVFSSVIVQMDDFSKVGNVKTNKVKFNDLLENVIADSEESTDIIAFSKRDGQVSFYITAKTRSEVREKIKLLTEKFNNQAKDVFDITLTIAIGTQEASFLKLTDTYKFALEAMEYKYILGKNQIIDEKVIRRYKRNDESEGYVDFDDKALVSSIKFSDPDKLKKHLNDLEKKIRLKGKNSYIFTNIIVGSIYRQALQELEETGGKIEDIFEDSIDVYTAIISQETITGMISQLHDALLEISVHISSMLLGKSAQIEKAKDYIYANYSNSEISLEEVAKHVNMSVSYFSNIFKQEMQMTFVDFLTSVRIENAKEFLKKEYKSYEVSELVGYNNSTYFSTVFKRVTGVAPSKFK